MQSQAAEGSLTNSIYSVWRCLKYSPFHQAAVVWDSRKALLMCRINSCLLGKQRYLHPDTPQMPVSLSLHSLRGLCENSRGLSLATQQVEGLTIKPLLITWGYSSNCSFHGHKGCFFVTWALPGGKPGIRTTESCVIQFLPTVCCFGLKIKPGDRRKNDPYFQTSSLQRSGSISYIKIRALKPRMTIPPYYTQCQCIHAREIIKRNPIKSWLFHKR